MRQFIRNRQLALVVAVLSLAAVARIFSQRQDPPTQTEIITFRIIVVESEDAARRVLEQLMKGENFVALARNVSVDPSASNGGLVGPVSIADLRPQLRSILERLRVGDTSEIVRLPTGFGILKIVPESETAANTTAGASSSSTVMTSVNSALAGTGSVKYVYNLSGFAETVLSLRQAKISPEDGRDLAFLCRARKQVLASAHTFVQKALADVGNTKMAPIDHAQVYVLQGSSTRLPATWPRRSPRSSRHGKSPRSKYRISVCNWTKRSASLICTKRKWRTGSITAPTTDACCQESLDTPSPRPRTC